MIKPYGENLRQDNRKIKTNPDIKTWTQQHETE